MIRQIDATLRRANRKGLKQLRPDSQRKKDNASANKFKRETHRLPPNKNTGKDTRVTWF
jgi:hypothetical protein